MLHNEDFIKERDIHIGDYVKIRKAGEIIPEVLALSRRGMNTKPFVFPKICPSCGSKVIKEEGEAVFRCNNTDCPAQLLRHLIHFSSRDAMDIDGLGPAVLEQLVSKKLINSFSDLYRLKAENVEPLERMGEKSAINLINAIEKSKEAEIYRIIYALGIRHIGQKAAKLLCEHFLSIDNIISAGLDELSAIDGFGDIMAKSVVDYFSLAQTQKLISELKSLGVKMSPLTSKKDGGIFDNKTFVLTGTLSKFTRNEASAIIEQNGGKTSSSVSKKTNYVLAGEEAGSKLTKAVKLGVKIISEEEFLNMINNK